MNRSVMIGLVALAFVGRTGAAQTVASDSNAVWFNWRPLGVIIEGDSVHGIRIWTVDGDDARGRVPPTPFNGRFRVADVKGWLTRADEVLDAPAHAADSLTTDLATPVLQRDSGIGGLVLLRLRDTSGWNTVPVLDFKADSARRGFSMALTSAEALGFVSKLRWFLTRVVHIAPPIQLDSDVAINAADHKLDEPPVPRLVGRPRWPTGVLTGGVTASVILEFVVDTTGRVEPTSLRTVFATDGRFIASARTAALAERFKPGRLSGRAVRVLVNQTVRYRS